MSSQRTRPVAKPIDPQTLSQKVRQIAHDYGAVSVGISTLDTLAGGPPSTDITYVLPEAKSAITLAMPLDQAKIDDYLAKRDRKGHQADYVRTGTIATGVAAQLAGYLAQLGHKSIGVQSNEVYRNDDDHDPRDLKPDVSHRLLAARSGVGWMGFSGNVLTPTHGANVILATAVTNAQLIATDPLPVDDSYCDDCMNCNASCAAGFFSFGQSDKETVTMGGVTIQYAARRHYHRCSYVCVGYTGLHSSGKWSTWSPGRFAVPRKDDDLKPAVKQTFNAWMRRPNVSGGALHQPMMYQATGKDVPLTCGNCALICTPSREGRDQRLETLQTSGVTIQDPDGTLRAVTPEQARAHMDGLDEETRALYEPVEGRK